MKRGSLSLYIFSHSDQRNRGEQEGGVGNVSMNVHGTLHARVGQQRLSGLMQTESATKHNKNKSNNSIF